MLAYWALFPPVPSPGPSSANSGFCQGDTPGPNLMKFTVWLGIEGTLLNMEPVVLGMGFIQQTFIV